VSKGFFIITKCVHHIVIALVVLVITSDLPAKYKKVLIIQMNTHKFDL